MNTWTNFSGKLLIGLILQIGILASVQAVDQPTSPPWSFEMMAGQLIGLSRAATSLAVPSIADENNLPHATVPVKVAPLNPLQANKILVALKPWQAQVFLTPTEAKTVWSAVQAILTPEQRAWKPASGFGSGNNQSAKRAPKDSGQNSDTTNASRTQFGANLRNTAAAQNFETRHLAMIQLTLTLLSRLAGIDVPVTELGESSPAVPIQTSPAPIIPFPKAEKSHKPRRSGTTKMPSGFRPQQSVPSTDSNESKPPATD